MKKVLILSADGRLSATLEYLLSSFDAEVTVASALGAGMSADVLLYDMDTATLPENDGFDADIVALTGEEGQSVGKLTKRFARIVHRPFDFRALQNDLCQMLYGATKETRTWTLEDGILTDGEKRIAFTPKELALLSALLSSSGVFKTPDDLGFDDVNAFRVHLNALKKKLPSAYVIENKKGVGYRLMRN